ncbi:MAG TPA: coenzyme F420-0:L-glutamate ligase [Candidatus Saccharimonadales bacterium]|nr:coenzyme F420-0:L-glutamate ligase [Candidatus Saccharimonadales bacterium]
MIVNPIKTLRVLPGQKDLEKFLDDNLKALEENSIIAITSKVVSLCEGRVAAMDSDKEKLVKSEAELYFPAEHNRYRHHFTIARKTILGSSGIDESNGGGNFVLLPDDVQESANRARRHLQAGHGLKNLGVIITDSTSLPMRLGAVGTCLAYSGFMPVNDYRHTMDLFGREFQLEQANIIEGLAAAATLAMGEGAEQTPLCVISDFPLVHFRDSDPTHEELDGIYLSLSEDLFSSFFNNGEWQKGGRGKL